MFCKLYKTYIVHYNENSQQKYNINHQMDTICNYNLALMHSNTTIQLHCISTPTNYTQFRTLCILDINKNIVTYICSNVQSSMPTIWVFMEVLKYNTGHINVHATRLILTLFTSALNSMRRESFRKSSFGLHIIVYSLPSLA